MTDIDEQQDQLIRLLSAVHQIPDSASRPDGPAADELRRLIMATSATDRQAVNTPRRRARWSLRRRLALTVPTVAALAAAAIVVTAVLPRSGPGGPAPAQAALGFSEDHGYLTVRILNPVADPARYKAEFAKHGLDIDLSVEPVQADQVGRVVFEEDDNLGGPQLKWIEAPGNCSANGNCSVAIQVPLNYHGHAQITFGRTAKPGEVVPGPAGNVSPSQDGQLQSLVGMRVSDARGWLTAHGETADYRVGWQSLRATADQVPGDWYVYQVAPVPDNVVVLWASADGKAPTPPRNPSAQPSQRAG